MTRGNRTGAPAARPGWRAWAFQPPRGTRRLAAGLALAVAALAVAHTPAQAKDLHLALPLECVLGETCFIQNYVDADPGPGARDFACGTMSYDGHKGTDFALPSRAALAAGVAVRAAAPGVVRAVRDGMPDTGLDGTPPEQLDGKDCGNGVVIAHGDGWESQYCHLKQGSIAVRRGDRVAAGRVLGEVGYSGRTEMPHLHLSLRKDGAVVDPFNPEGRNICADGAAAPAQDLWQAPIGYEPAGVIAVGAAPEVPAYAAIKAGTAHHPTLPPDAPALVGWAYTFGTRPGDVVEITLTAPGGAPFHSREITIERPTAQMFRASGKRRVDGLWPSGLWRVTATLRRAGALLDSRSTTIVIGD